MSESSLFFPIKFMNPILICSKVFGDLFSPTSECYPYNNYKSLMSVENTVVGRMARKRRIRQRVSRQRSPSCPE